MVLAGTASTPGAARLAAEAALRAGAGKLTVLTCQATAASLAVALPEAMVVPLGRDLVGAPGASAVDEVVSRLEGADAVLVGCGFFDADETFAFLATSCPACGSQLVLDATASAYLRTSPRASIIWTAEPCSTSTPASWRSPRV